MTQALGLSAMLGYSQQDGGLVRPCWHVCAVSRGCLKG